MGQKIIKNRKRSETLIADFDDIGYVIGWKFKVSASFKDALDIKLTDRTKEGVKKLVWTQGLIYDFQQGDSISDYRSTENWGHDLQHIKNYLQIENAIPCSIDEEITDVNGKQEKKLVFTPGFVRFAIYGPDMSKTTLEVVDRRECTQVEFVEILKNGLDALNTIYQQCSSNNMQEV